MFAAACGSSSSSSSGAVASSASTASTAGARTDITTKQGSHAFGADWYVLAPSGDKVDNS
jgi:hypothetical protein